MFEYMNGQITYVSPYYIVLEVNGIGYQINVANPFSYQLSDIAERVYVHQVVREDAHALYGFRQLSEKMLFLKLISVSGIGPKSALAIMAVNDHQGLIQAIANQNVSYLTKFPGVGKKTSQQMILDLKDKLDDLIEGPLLADSEKTVTSESRMDALDEALEALRALGYSEREVKKIRPKLVDSESLTTDGYLRQGLKLLMMK